MPKGTLSNMGVDAVNVLDDVEPFFIVDRSCLFANREMKSPS